ncbi:SYF2-domain-containing protein [Ascodesmis nigricans]|uniref:Pre-mRNA-splicing factor SYF2 n=1 Tax=Ascodesmis nigricans TaxID=341454 RepID=A0A4S2N564_9PEZI|nr:SYF2-domain-containing protein [Ascodesmis nigricans]
MSTVESPSNPTASELTSPEPNPSPPSEAAPTTTTAADRLAKWKALKARAAKSSTQNLAAVRAERQRQQQDPGLSSKLQRKRAEAEFKLAKAEAFESGEDFERKRAWDWTIEESERWDRRMEKKKRHVEDVAFQDFQQSARKMYKKSMRELKPDVDGYMKEKAKLLKDGQVVETEDGELIVVDRDGGFYADKDSLGFVENKPTKEAVDRLVKDLQKAEDKRMARRKETDDGDVSFINDKNKKFNAKLERAYGKYTKDIKDNFERGTAL